jgi:uncharacterized Zn-finger protein
MSTSTPSTPSSTLGAVIELHAGEQPVCPNKAMPLWSSHPKVFLQTDEKGHAACPYCGTQYHVPGGKAH